MTSGREGVIDVLHLRFTDVLFRRPTRALFFPFRGVVRSAHGGTRLRPIPGTTGAGPTRNGCTCAIRDAAAVVLPKGEPRAGRQAFLDLKCTVCHRVTQDPDFPAPVSRSQGPELDHTLRLRPASEVAAAIIVPSHSMSLKTSDEVKKHLEGVLSPMGDFSRTITVRQLADLLAYLQSLETVR